jgi:Skp family chaperone for outer membrane proteins
MRAVLVGCLALVFAAGAVAQTGSTASKKKSATTTTAEELRALREMLQAQQQQIQQMQEEMRRRDQMLQQMEHRLSQTQTAASEAQNRAAVAENSASQQQSVEELRQQVQGISEAMTSAALSTQEDQKRVGNLETLVNRFRLGGDIRVRYENFFQDHDLCTNCFDRHRMRVRLRFGVQGQVNEDFIGGFYIASGSFDDPVSTNQTLTDFFNRKTIGIDRAWVAYNPANRKWLELTGGKWAYTWQRSPLTFDNDLNPEGFSERFSWKLPGFFQEVNLTGMQMFLEERSGAFDSFAVGGQAATKFAAGPVSFTPSYTLINWRNEARISNQVGVTLAGNRNTNATTADGKNFLSEFLQSEFMVNANIKTPMERWPVNLMFNWVKNLDAVAPCARVTCDPLLVASPALLDTHDTAYWVEGSIGGTRNKNDMQFGYRFARIEQDAVLAAFNESDLRAPTNVLQHAAFWQWKVMKNTTASYTLWVGRTLDPDLVSAGGQTPSPNPNGLLPGEKEPFLKRMQFDLIYAF